MDGLKIVVAGAGGRMGGANIRAITASPLARLVAALDRPGSPALGTDAGVLAGLPSIGVPVGDNAAAALAEADAVIDFSSPAASVALARDAAGRGLVHVIGTTDCSDADDEAIAQAARDGARIVKSGNFSLGVAVLAALVRQAAAKLADYDIEIVEMHHGRKVDAPSGTALLLGEAAAEARGIALSEHRVPAREGHTGARVAGTIGFAALRGGTVVGDHSVVLAGPSERIELTHRAEDRAIFAHGALRAALWAANQKPGLYTMDAVLGLG